MHTSKPARAAAALPAASAAMPAHPRRLLRHHPPGTRCPRAATKLFPLGALPAKLQGEKRRKAMRNQREETDQYFAASEMGEDSVADEYTKGKGQAMDAGPLAAACRGPSIQSHRQLLAGAWRTPAGQGHLVALFGSLASHFRGNSIFHIQMNFSEKFDVKLNKLYLVFKLYGISHVEMMLFILLMDWKSANVMGNNAARQMAD